MDVARDPRVMQRRALEWRSRGEDAALVPTMGYLHEGHLSLIRIAREKGGRVVASLFVNPTQFGPEEDLDRYPRAVERDLALCEAKGVDVVFLPDAGAMYAPDASVTVREDRLSTGLCGVSRPGHFSGVLTVVAKLFNLCQPRWAVFGEKDAQQLRLIRRMARDLDFPVEIVSGPVVREEDGLALSSRNANLSPEARAQAPALRRALLALERAARGGVTSIRELRQLASGVLDDAPLGELDYLDLVDDETLEPVDVLGDRPVLAALAVKFPGARLIDNVVISTPRGA